MLSATHKRTFCLGIEEYAEKMKWINDFMESNGFKECIFTDINKYEQSVEDYDYYYEFKTPSQYVKEKLQRTYSDKLNGSDIDKLCSMMTSASFYSMFTSSLEPYNTDYQLYFPWFEKEKEERIRVIRAINEYLISRGINEVFTKPDSFEQCNMEFKNFIHGVP